MSVDKPTTAARRTFQFSLKTLLVLMLLSAVGMSYLSNRPIELESSSIRTVQYNHFTRTLQVEFQSGDAYRYFKQDLPRAHASQVPRLVFLQRDSQSGF